MRFSLMNEQNVRLDTNFLLVYKKYGCEKITKSNQNKNVNHTTEKKKINIYFKPFSFSFFFFLPLYVSCNIEVDTKLSGHKIRVQFYIQFTHQIEHWQ